MNVHLRGVGLNFVHALASAAVYVAALSGTAARANNSAHAMAVSGLAGHAVLACATSGPQPGVLAKFNTGNGLPTEGYAYCGLAGGIDDNSSATGVSAAHVDLVYSGNSFNKGLHKQTSDATADFGVLKASSSGSYTGDPGGGFLFAQGEGGAVSTDTLPTPGASYMELGLTIHGSASVAKTSQVIILFNYQINSGQTFTIFHADLTGDTASVRGLDRGARLCRPPRLYRRGWQRFRQRSGLHVPDRAPFEPDLRSDPRPLCRQLSLAAQQGDLANTYSLTKSASAVSRPSTRADILSTLAASPARRDASTTRRACIPPWPPPKRSSTWAMTLTGFAGLGWSRSPAEAQAHGQPNRARGATSLCDGATDLSGDGAAGPCVRLLARWTCGAWSEALAWACVCQDVIYRYYQLGDFEEIERWI